MGINLELGALSLGIVQQSSTLLLHIMWSIITSIGVLSEHNQNFLFCNCCQFCIQQIGSPSGNSYFLLSRPQPSDSPPKEAAPSIGPQAPPPLANSTSAAESRDFFRDAINTSGIGYVTKDDNLADIPPQQVKKVDILSLGLPRLSTGRKLYMLHL